MSDTIMNSIIDIASKTQIDSVIKEADETSQNIKADKKLNISFVSDIYGKRAIFKIIADLCGEKIDGKYIPQNDNPFCLCCVYGESKKVAVTTESISNKNGDEECEFTKIVLEMSSKILTEESITIYCGFAPNMLSRIVFDNTDYLFLFTNATMAFPLSEKDWVKESVVKYYDFNRFAVVLYNASLLNTRNEVTDVCNNVKQILQKVSTEAVFYEDPQNIYSSLLTFSSESARLSEARKKAIIRNCVSEIEEQINSKLSTCGINLEKLKALIENVDRERTNIEISGKITVNNTVENLYLNLKYKIINAADEYNSDIYRSIAERISTTDKIKSDIENISPYITKAWEKFEKEADDMITRDQVEIANEIVKQIETDCCTLMNSVDIPGFETILPDFRFNAIAGTHKSFDVSEATRKEKLFSKGSLLAAIALTFVHPVLGISTLVGSRVYTHMKKKETELDLRKSVLDGLASECNDIKKKVIDQVGCAIDSVRDKTKKNVEEVYTEVFDSLMDEMRGAVIKVEDAKKNSGILTQAIKEINEVKGTL